MGKRVGATTIDNVGHFPGFATFCWDPVSDCIAFSPEAEAVLGIQNLVDTNSFFERIHPDDRIRLDAEMTSHLESGGQKTTEFRWMRAHDSVLHVMTHSTVMPCKTAGHDQITGLIIDVTEARQRSAAWDTSGDKIFGTYDMDVRTGVSVWSPALHHMFRETPSAPVTAEQIHRRVHPDDRDWVTRRMQDVMKRPGPFELIFRVVLPNGKVLRVHDKGKAHTRDDDEPGTVTHVTGKLTDITQMSEGASGLTLANDAFWRLIDAAPFGAYAIDSNMRLIHLNKVSFAAFAGVENLVGRDLAEVLRIIWPEPFASEALARFRHTLDTGEPCIAPVVIQERADRGTLEAYDWSLERILVQDGRPGVLCYFYNLSERVRYEQRLEEQQRWNELAHRAARLGAWEVDLVTGLTTGTAQMAELFDETGPTSDVNAMWQRAIHPEERSRVDQAFKTALEGGYPFDIDFRVKTQSGSIRHLSAKGEVIQRSDGRPVKMIGVNQDITQRKETEILLRATQERLRTVINNVLAFVGVLDPDGTLREVNEPALEFGGIDRAAVIGKPFWDCFWWMHDPDVAERCRQSVKEGQAGRTARFDVKVRGKGDQIITIDYLLASVVGPDGKVDMLVASGFDISEREEARSHTKALMGEVNHRTKNILSLVQVVARHTARGGHADFVARFEERVVALSKAQDLLINGMMDTVDLRDLVRSQLGHFRDAIDRRIRLSGAPVSLVPHAAQVLGMALHELGTNAGKYGALSNDTGSVDISWQINPETSMFEIAWTEQGGPVVVPPEASGFGSKVISQMVQSTLNAEVSLDFAAEGVRWRLQCNLSSLDTPK